MVVTELHNPLLRRAHPQILGVDSFLNLLVTLAECLSLVCDQNRFISVSRLPQNASQTFLLITLCLKASIRYRWTGHQLHRTHGPHHQSQMDPCVFSRINDYCNNSRTFCQCPRSLFVICPPDDHPKLRGGTSTTYTHYVHIRLPTVAKIHSFLFFPVLRLFLSVPHPWPAPPERF